MGDVVVKIDKGLAIIKLIRDNLLKGKKLTKNRFKKEDNKGTYLGKSNFPLFLMVSKPEI